VLIAGKSANPIGTVRDDANGCRPLIIKVFCSVKVNGDLLALEDVSLAWIKPVAIVGG